MVYKLIINTFIFSTLMLILEFLLMILLRKIAYKKEYRFKQTRLLSEIFLTFMILTLFIFFFGAALVYNRSVYYSSFSTILFGYILIEIYTRKTETDNNDISKVNEFNADKELTAFRSFFYEEYKEEKETYIIPKKRTKIYRYVTLIFISVNCALIFLFPLLNLFEVFRIDASISVLLSCVNILLTEFYLFLSQSEDAAKNARKKQVHLLQSPKEWSTEFEKKYGSQIVGYSNTIATKKAETSITLDNLGALSRDIVNGKNILVSNSSKYETKAIYYNVINKDFINDKATIIIYEDIPSLKEAKEIIDTIIEEYNNELVVKVISKNQNNNTKTDKDINIYIATVQDLIEANIDYEKIQTIIINNADKIIEKNPNELYVLSTTLKNLEYDYQYIMLSVTSSSLRIALKNILLIDEYKEYQINRKNSSQTLSTQVLKRSSGNIKNHNNNYNDMNDLVKIAIETNRFSVDNVEIVSKKMPILNDFNRFDEVRGNRENLLTNKELNDVTNRIKINCNNLFQENADKKMFIKNDDENNILYGLKAYSELNNGETYLGLVASNYMLRDYIIYDYLKNKDSSVDLDLIIPQTMQNDAKILLGALLLQMLNVPVKEDVIIRRLKEYNKNLILVEGYNKLNIVTSINTLLETEFEIKTDISSYLIETVDKLGRKEYMLNDNFKAKLPKDVCDRAKIILSGYEQEITNPKGYEIYQKYIPGQIHLIENKVYKIDDIEDLDICVSNVSPDKLRKYKQDTEIKLSNIVDVEEEEEVRDYSKATIRTQIQKANVDIDILGYYEFLDYTTLENGSYVYRQVPKIQKEKMSRKYFNSRVLRLEITPKDEEIKKIMVNDGRDKLSCTLAFLLNELLESLLDENLAYITARATISNKSLLDNEEIKLYRPIIEKKVEPSSIVIYIIEDLKISKGLLTTIENEILRLLLLIKKYLIWYEGLENKEETYINGINVNNTLMFKEINKIISNIF